MASTNHTTNYDLPQWERTDAFKMEDFNDAFSKIDTQIKNARDAAGALVIPRVEVGTYTGNGASTQDITLGFRPKAVIVWEQGYSQLGTDQYIHGGIAIEGQPALMNAVALTETGFRVAKGYVFSNQSAVSYTYIAFA